MKTWYLETKTSLAAILFEFESTADNIVDAVEQLDRMIYELSGTSPSEYKGFIKHPNKGFKVIGRSNFDNESVSDILAGENMDETVAKILAKALNDRGGNDSTYYFEAKPTDYQLYEWQP